MKEVVWIAGRSAAGKDYFIKHITEKAPVDLIEQLGWQGKVIAACNESIEYTDQDNADILREEILTIVPALIESADIVLIKWQYIDSTKSNRIKKLKELLPNSKHGVIYLDLSPEINAERLKSKAWWKKQGNDGQEMSNVEFENAEITNKLNELFPGTSILKIDCNVDDHFKILK